MIWGYHYFWKHPCTVPSKLKSRLSHKMHKLHRTANRLRLKEDQSKCNYLSRIPVPATLKDVTEITSSMNAAFGSLHMAISKVAGAVDMAGSLNSTVDSLEEILPRQKGRIPRKPEDLVLWIGYLIFVSYVLMQLVLRLSKWLCCHSRRRKEPKQEFSEKASLKRPPFLPSSDSFLPPLRPHPHDETRPRKKTPECCIFNFCS